MVPGVLSKYKGLSALAELRSAAGAFETVFLPFLHPRVAGEEARFLEGGAEGLVILEQSSGNAVADGAGLAGHAAAGNAADNVELAGGLSQLKGLTDDELKGLETEILIYISVAVRALDDDPAGAGVKADSRDALFSAACAVPE